MAGQPGLFDFDERYRALAESGDPLIRLSALIDFEVFRAPLVQALARSDGSRGGRPPYDPVLMFKILVLQTLYTLSDAAAEFQIKDRLSFMRFLGLRAARQGAGCQDDLAVPRAPDPNWIDPGPVRHLRCPPEGTRVSGHVGSDRGRFDHRCPAPAQH